MKPKKNEEFETEMWRSPFTPNKPTTALLGKMAGNLYAYYEEDGFKLFAVEIRTHAGFKRLESSRTSAFGTAPRAS